GTARQPARPLKPPDRGTHRMLTLKQHDGLKDSPEIGQRRKLRSRCLLVFNERNPAMTKRKQHKAEFKVLVALEALKASFRSALSKSSANQPSD
ncbi:MAG: hypothetical protein O3C34_17440, partial [Proteobacteria bacterium]|nr:hypothetical protein [Pseudomonadota bacterium]